MARTKSAGAGSLEPGTTRHSRPPLCAQDPRCRTARGLAAADRACCRLVDSGSAGFAGGRGLAPRTTAGTPRAGHPAMQRASHVTPQRLTCRANQAWARGLQVLTCPPRVASSRPVDPADRPPDPKACPPRELLRNSNQSDLWTTHPAVSAKGAERSSAVIGGSVLPREARGHAATRIAPGICVSAGTDCRQSSELEPRH
jgi:hypothetical protein